MISHKEIPCTYPSPVDHAQSPRTRSWCPKFDRTPGPHPRINSGRRSPNQQNSVVVPLQTSEMAFKFLVLAAFVAVASAGGPAAYDIGTLSADHNSIGYSQESTQKGYAGQNVVSTYSRAEDSAHSSVRVSNSHVSNDALLEHHAIGYAAPALAKSAYIAQPVLAKTAYAAPALTYAAHAAPVIAKAAYAPSAYGYAAAAPAAVIAKTTAYAAPAAYSYSSPIVAKTYAAPLVAKTAYTTYAAPAAPLIAKAAYAAPAAYSYSSPIVAKTYAAPVLAKTAIAAAPALTYAAHAAPAALTYAAHPAPVVAKTYAAPYSYETAAPVVHATFSGFGTSYAW